MKCLYLCINTCRSQPDTQILHTMSLKHTNGLNDCGYVIQDLNRPLNRRRSPPKSSRVTVYAHTVTCSTLWTLLHQAFDAYREEDPQPLSFEDWCSRHRESHPQFDYRYTVWKVELLLLVFVRSLREGNFHSLSAFALSGPHALLEVASSPHSGHGDPTCASPRRSRAILTGQVCGAEDKQAIFCNISR